MRAQNISLPSPALSPPTPSRSLAPSGRPITINLGTAHRNSAFGFCNSLERVSKSPIVSRKRGGSLYARCGMDEERSEDEAYMRKCVEIARKAIGCTSPNPMVGCVIVKDGHLIGQGFHPKAGQPHAEVFALKDAGDSAENATAYVSLEPCNHYGRTPPCTEALINARVKRVVVGMVDPNPIVASKGVKKLRDVGIQVTVGVEEEMCKSLNEFYIHQMLTGKPFVTLRYSLSVNGKIVDQLGEGAANSGGYYSRLLQEYDAVIVSSASMAKRIPVPASKEPGANQPFLIIAESDGDSATNGHDLLAESAAEFIIFSNKKSAVDPKSAEEGAEMLICEKMNLGGILEDCKRRGFCSVLIDLRVCSDDVIVELVGEGLEQKLLQKVVVEVLPFWVESESESDANNFKSIVGLKRLPKTLGMNKFQSKISGNSVLLEGYF